MKAILIAALIVGGSSAAFARDKTVSYVFEDDSGNPYCDGVQLQQIGVIAVGLHTGGSECTVGDYAGGFLSKISHMGKQWAISTTDTNNKPGSVLVFLLDEKHKTWVLYAESTPDGLTFQDVGSGILAKGRPPHRLGSKPVSSILATFRKQ